MSLTNLHTIATHQNYVLLRDLEIKRAEDKHLLAGSDLRSLGPRPDNSANSAFIGYGIDFRKNSVVDIQAWYTQAGLSAFLTPNDLNLLTNYQTNPTSTNRQALAAMRCPTTSSSRRSGPSSAPVPGAPWSAPSRSRRLSMEAASPHLRWRW